LNERIEGGLEARVVAQCWKPFGKAQQICCEQIEITATRKNWPTIIPTIIGIRVPDLPVVLWSRQAESFSPHCSNELRSALESLMDLAHKTIIDSRAEPATEAFQTLTGWKAKGRIVGDLEWARLTPWRQPIAQIFDNPARENRFSNFTDIEVTYAGDSPSPSVFYMAAWLSAPYEARISFARAEGSGKGLQRVFLHSESENITMERVSEDTVHLYSTNGRERTYNLPELSLHALMDEELAVLGPDPTFDAAFSRAKELASR
jgi:glucose-6-phosphate dehydrogenase assembly protein OpcA